MNTKPLYTRENARRMAATMIQTRREQGENIEVPCGTRKLAALPANVLAVYAMRPKAFRTAVLTSAAPNVVTFRIGTV